ncbi:MAG TPA: metalloregulator ArsR/SmtB family transcription factor [Mycobacteriales bacterium]|nr:metalloregulator ArsR/SmtB family transcription factor [Mycobacteriales bacterium]
MTATRSDAAIVDCCTPLDRQPLSAAAAAELAVVLKALAEPTRLRLLSLIAAHADGEACVCDLSEPIELTQPTVSHHLKVLHDAGLVTRERRGTWVYYKAVPERLASLSQLLAVPTPA